jgi:diamine N-acetyltransferase
MPPSADRPYGKSAYDLAGVTLGPITPSDADALAAGLAAIEPWRRLQFAASSLAGYLTREDPAASRFAIREDGALIGVIAVREPWLRGPYLELLGLLPPAQGRGIGGTVMTWFQSEAPKSAANLWVLCSDFNAAALTFYERLGFHRLTAIESLVGEGFNEILLRKHLSRSG